MSDDSLAARVDAALAAGDAATARAACVEALSRAPKDMDAYRLLGRTMESEGRAEDAVECHLGRLPPALEAALWPGVERNDAASHGARTIAGHAEERRPARSATALAEPPLAHLAAAGLRAEPTETTVIEGGSVWHDGFNTVPCAPRAARRPRSSTPATSSCSARAARTTTSTG